MCSSYVNYKPAYNLHWQDERSPYELMFAIKKYLKIYSLVYQAEAGVSETFDLHDWVHLRKNYWLATLIWVGLSCSYAHGWNAETSGRPAGLRGCGPHFRFRWALQPHFRFRPEGRWACSCRAGRAWAVTSGWPRPQIDWPLNGCRLLIGSCALTDCHQTGKKGINHEWFLDFEER